MQDLKKKLGYTSFAELSADELEKSMRLLRNVKLKFFQCAEMCYQQNEIDLKEWKGVRQQCIDRCKIPHDTITQIFVEKYPEIRDKCVKCVLESSTEYPVSKSGEEDLKIAEEKCYENMLQQIADLSTDLGQKYQSVYLEKFDFT